MSLGHLMSRGPAAPAAATTGLLVPLVAIDRRLQATGGPGIVPFELAGSARSDAILERWGEAGRRWAIASLVLDFPFLAAYTTLNLVLIERLRQRVLTRGERFLALLARPVAALQIVAGVSDAIENAALLVVVARRGDPDRAELARRAAQTKFAALGIGWAYATTVVALSPARAKRGVTTTAPQPTLRASVLLVPIVAAVGAGILVVFSGSTGALQGATGTAG